MTNKAIAICLLGSLGITFMLGFAQIEDKSFSIIMGLIIIFFGVYASVRLIKSPDDGIKRKKNDGLAIEEK